MDGIPDTTAKVQIGHKLNASSATAAKVDHADYASTGTSGDNAIIDWIVASYDGTPGAGGAVSIIGGAGGVVTYFTDIISSSGVKFYKFPGGFQGEKGFGFRITAGNPGSGVTGKITVGYR